MWRWTLKSLFAEPLALAASIAAAGSAFLLVMFFEAVYAGESEQIVAYAKHADADVWVMQRGVSNMHMATSYLSDWKLQQVRQLEGVADVEGILYLNTVIESGGQKWFAYIVGLDTPSRQAGPWAMAAGRGEPATGEAVVPAVFAEMATLELGDSVRITNRNFTIVGFSDGTFSMANSIIFVTKNDLEDIMTSLDIVSYGLVKAAPGVAPTVLAARIEQEIEKVRALPADQFIINDQRMAMQMGVETIALMTIIGGALAILLVAFTVFSQVDRQRRELAVAKALGATNRSLYISVGVQAIVITLSGVMLAVVLASGVMPLATALIPAVNLKLTTAAVVRIALVGIAVTLIASLIPAQKIARLDPLSAFQT